MIDKSQILNVKPKPQPISDMKLIIPTVSPTIGNTIVSGSASPGSFLSDAVNELLTYRTPKEIIDFIKNEETKSIIGNPPYDVKS